MAADSTYIKGMLANASAYTADTIDASGHLRVTVSPSCVQVDYVRAFLPKDTVSGINHNREVSFSYTIGSCIPTGENEIKNAESVKVFPNPAKDKITIILPESMEQFQINLINMLGQIILQTQSNLSAGQAGNMDVSSIPNGIYFINIKTTKYEVNKKVVINR